MLAHCNAVSFVLSSCTLKVLALTVVCIISSCNPLFAAWSAFSLPGIPVWVGIKLIVGLCVKLDSASLMALIITDAESLSLIIISLHCVQLPPPPVSRLLNRRFSTCCRLVENGSLLAISVSVFSFPPESSLSYIRMVVVPIGQCRLFVVVLVPPIVLIRVGDIPVSPWSIHFVVSC